MSGKQGGRGGAAANKAKKGAKPGAEEKRKDVLQAVVRVTQLWVVASM